MELSDQINKYLGSYSSLHIALLQLVMSLRTISQEELFNYFQKALVTLILDDIEPNDTLTEPLQNILDKDDGKLSHVSLKNLTGAINRINTQLHNLDFEIVSSKDMDDTTRVLLTFVNKKSTGSIRLSSEFSEKEIEMIQNVIERIFDPEYCFQTGQILYSVPYMKMIKYLKEKANNTYSFEDVENFLELIECQGWLERTHNEYIISCRALVELRPFLLDTYKAAPEGTISICNGCNDLLTRGLRCSNPECYISLHKNCKNLVADSRGNDDCPNENCDRSLQTYYEFH